MKKKITALCLVVALALVAIGGATMAYFTDNDKQNNTFAIGNIDIKVDEYGYVYDPATKTTVKDAITYTDEGMTFTNIMPSYVMSKRPIISNESTRNAAYVRVAVVLNNTTGNFTKVLNDAIDNHYENLTTPYTSEQIQAVYDNVFAGWGINYNKSTDVGRARLWMNQRTDSKVLHIDYVRNVEDYTQFSLLNMFKSDEEIANNLWDGTGSCYLGDSYYAAAMPDNSSILYVFYLKLDAGESYQLFGGLNAPADFNNEQMKMFDGLQIGIYADAIQTVGFSGENAAVDAFTALEAEHPLGWWKAE